jgi:hypothetical protein
LTVEYARYVPVDLKNMTQPADVPSSQTGYSRNPAFAATASLIGLGFDLLYSHTTIVTVSGSNLLYLLVIL